MNPMWHPMNLTRLLVWFVALLYSVCCASLAPRAARRVSARFAVPQWLSRGASVAVVQPPRIASVLSDGSPRRPHQTPLPQPRSPPLDTQATPRSRRRSSRGLVLESAVPRRRNWLRSAFTSSSPPARCQLRGAWLTRSGLSTRGHPWRPEGWTSETWAASRRCARRSPHRRREVCVRRCDWW